MSVLDAHGTRELLRKGTMSVTDHVAGTLAAIDRLDPVLGAYVAVAREDALAAAEAADALIRRSGADAWRSWPLLGLTVSVKDLIQTECLPTSRGSLLENRRPRVDAPAVARLKAAGAIVIGKTTTSEHGWSASTVSRVAEPTRNPWAPHLTAGGSSGGAAAAVAARLCDLALGTDGAGSIRIPSAFCGVVGFKPSFARIPYVPPCADRLAHLGPIVTSVRDAAEVYKHASGAHPGDPDSWGVREMPRRRRAALRVGWLEFPGTSAEVREVCERASGIFAASEYQLERVDVPFEDTYPALVDLIAAGEAAGTDPSDEQWCDPGRLAIVHYGQTVTGKALVRAAESHLRLRASLHALFDRYDLLAMATVPIEPFDPYAVGPAWAAEPADLQWLGWAPAVHPFNVTGHPAVSLPAGLTAAGLPVGMQLVGTLGRDEMVLTAAAGIEAELAFRQHTPVVPIEERVQ
ncbi:amidase [Amycolatopsis sp. lyj-90]|uniref:amidase n=1 Tax=Amycolatopsis sp. lyj-90 TaxID=2789285 RepID=UPI003977EFC9